MSRLENLRQWWRDHPVLNSKNWNEKFWIQNIYDGRILYAFFAGLALPLFFNHISIAPTIFHQIAIGLLYCVLIALLILIDRIDVRYFRRRFPEQEAFA